MTITPSAQDIIENGTPGIRYSDWPSLKPQVYAALTKQGRLKEYREHCANLKMINGAVQALLPIRPVPGASWIALYNKASKMKLNTTARQILDHMNYLGEFE